MDVIALISGGKDSIYNLLHCIRNGHRIVALGNLHPQKPDSNSTSSSGYEVTSHFPSTAGLDGGSEGKDEREAPITTELVEGQKDELDSFMYQTIGHNLLPLYPSLLGIPMYRTAIMGGAVCKDLAYQPHQKSSDETEDLYRLLTRILQYHPTAKAVSTGAILSTYQRTRVESVCTRLGLISLAYLWHRPQHVLLQEMGSAGLDARIVKVAAAGMEDVEGWLWQNVTSPTIIHRLEGLKRRWGVNVAGEGGEYETVVVEGSGWGGRVVVPDGDAGGEGGYEVVRGEGGVGWVKILKGWVERREEGLREQKEWVGGVKRLKVLNGYFEGIWGGVKHWDGGEKDRSDGAGAEKATTSFSEIAISSSPSSSYAPQTTMHLTGNILTINNLTAPNLNSSSSTTIDVEITSLLNHLFTVLLPLTHTITSTHLLLRDMSVFTTINQIYNIFFSKPNPPTRVTVAIGNAMPNGINVIMHVKAAPSSVERKALHIQSRSYWAPANIGPYSQAVSTDGVVSISGMIGLIPGSMELPQIEDVPGIPKDREGGEKEAERERKRVGYETVLALQHMWKVAMEMKVIGYLNVVAYVTGAEGGRDWVELIWREHFAAVSEKEEVGMTPEEGNYEDSEEDEKIVGPRLWREGQVEDEIDLVGYVDDNNETSTSKRVRLGSSHACHSCPHPSLLIVQVPQLPRGAAVEWAGVGLDGEHSPPLLPADTTDIYNDSDADSNELHVKRRFTFHSQIIQYISQKEPSIHFQFTIWGLPTKPATINNPPTHPHGAILQFGVPHSEEDLAWMVYSTLMKAVGMIPELKYLKPAVVTVYLSSSFSSAVGEFWKSWDGACRDEGGDWDGSSHWRDVLQLVPVEKAWVVEGRMRGEEEVGEKVGETREVKAGVVVRFTRS